MEEKKNSGFKEYSFKNIKNKYILQYIFTYLTENKLLQIIKYNKNIQFKLNKDINDYIKYYKKVIIEITPNNRFPKNYFIKSIDKEEQQYYHIYFNNEKEERYRNYTTDDENVTKIKIIIDYKIRSFYGLFDNCHYIEKINFIKFDRKDIMNMRSMFRHCWSLKELNLNNFNTNIVTDMSHMFCGCYNI